VKAESMRNWAAFRFWAKLPRHLHLSRAAVARKRKDVTMNCSDACGFEYDLRKRKLLLNSKNTFKNNDLIRIFACANDLSLLFPATLSDMGKEAQCSTEKHIRVKKRARLVVQPCPLVTGNPAVRTLDHSAYPPSKQWVQLNSNIERDAVSLTRHAEKRPPVPGAICEQTPP
jgi:hypothetical protein